MSQQKNIKKLVKARKAKTGERYTTAMMHVLADGGGGGNAPPGPPGPPAPPARPPMHHGYDGPMPWEVEAQKTLGVAVQRLQFDHVAGVVHFDEDVDEHQAPVRRTFATPDELRAYLDLAYGDGWYGHVPFDSGEPVFDCDASDAVEDALAAYADDLDKLGWS